MKHVDPDELSRRMGPYVEEVGECWMWTGSTQWNCQTPVLRWGKNCCGVRRLVAIAQGLQVVDRMATTKCGQILCVRPEHIVLLTRKQLQLRTAARTDYEAYRAVYSAAARKRATKLNEDLARQIREAEGRQKDIAAAFGVSQHTVSMIKRGQMWRDYRNPFLQLLKP